VTVETPHVETVDRFETTIAPAQIPSEAAELWARRAELLARWLAAEWCRGHGEEVNR
jgi:hypothetical protein